VRQGEVAEVVAQVVYTSAHTCGIKLQVNAIDKTTWSRRSCCQGTILMVAIGERGKPLRIPQLVPETEQEIRDWDEVAEVHRRMLADRKR
jgi:acyl-CoA hydrolase